MKGLTYLSLFDGMSCFQIALKELGIPISKYYASEIDKFAMQQTQHNFPNTIQLGSIVDIDVSSLDHIDFIAGGSPCQSFSFAGKRAGMSTKCNEEIYTLERYLELKSAGFEFEGQSYLFWEYMRILTEVRKYNPDVKFLLENVEMGNKWERVLSEAIGVFGVHINSSLVSAQNRKRIYWTNIRVKQVGLFGELHSDIPQPKDTGILLRDILESDVDEKYYIKNPKFGFEGMDINRKGATLRTGGHQSQSDKHNFDIIKLDVKGDVKSNQDKASCFTAGANSGGFHEEKAPSMTSNSWEQNNLLVCHNMMPRSSKTKKGGTGHLTRNDGKTYCLDTSHTDAIEYKQRIRRLTPTECERLQTIPDWYKWIVSDTQQYRMLGNGWTVEVIIWILSFLGEVKVKLYIT